VVQENVFESTSVTVKVLGASFEHRFMPDHNQIQILQILQFRMLLVFMLPSLQYLYVQLQYINTNAVSMYSCGIMSLIIFRLQFT
jgi:hypothetical protein